MPFKVIPIVRVTQIAVFEEFNVFLLIADKSLIAYHLDVVCPPSGVAAQATTDSSRRAPQKLSGSREVGFFAAGHMKDRTLVMYKKRDGLSSTFKVCAAMSPTLFRILMRVHRYLSQSRRSRPAAEAAFSLVVRRRNSSGSTMSFTSLPRAMA